MLVTGTLQIYDDDGAELAPGEHTLQLLFADYTHTPHIPPVMSEGQ